MMRRGWRWLAVSGALVAGLMLTSCGGGGSPATTSASTETLTGVAATGAGVSGIVVLKDIPSGQIQATHTDDGSYAFNVTGLTGPFLLRIESDDHEVTLYGVALKSGNTTRGQINPLTNRIVARLAVSQPFTGNTDPALFFENPFLLPVDAASLAAAQDWVLDHTSPYFRQRLAAHGVDIATLDPGSDAFRIGEGLDLAFDDVRFFYDPQTGDAWEQSVASGAIVGSQKFVYGSEEPEGLSLTAPSTYMVPQGSQTLAVMLQLPYQQLPIQNGLRWEVSDESLATVDDKGVLTAKAFTGAHTLTVTAHYQSGDLHLQDAVTLTLNEQPLVDSVDMSGQPDSFEPLDAYPLFTTMQLGAAAGGGMLDNYSGTWTLVDADAETQSAVNLFTVGGVYFLSVGKPARDLSITLRAVQNVNGITTTTEHEFTVKKFVLKPVTLSMQCPYYVDYQVPSTCTARLTYNDGTVSDISSELVLSVAEADAPYMTVSGNTYTPNWDSRSTGRNTVLNGNFEGFHTTAQVFQSPRKTAMTDVEIVGFSEMAEGATNSLQAWGIWDDGTRTNISSQVRWTSSNTDVAVFTSYPGGALTARYILDQASDKTVTVTMEACRYKGYYTSSCPSSMFFTRTTDVTVRYATPQLTGVNVDLGPLASGFLAESATYELQANAVWNKKLPNGSAYTSPISSGATWSSSNPGATVSGNLLTVGAGVAEPLTLISASYQDPNDSGVTRTGRKVVTVYAPLNAPQYLDMSPVGHSDPGLYLLGGEGFARQVGYSYDSSLGTSAYRAGAPIPFISHVKQVVGLTSYSPRAYVRTDGTLWYPELVSGTTLSAEMRQQLIIQQGSNYSSATVPRQVPGLTNVSAAAATTWSGSPGLLHVLKSDGTVWAVVVSQNSTTGVTSYSFSQQLSNVRKLASSPYVMFVLDNAGKVWSRGSTYASIGRDGSAAEYGKVVKADLTELSGIVDVVASYEGNGLALDQQGTLWSWGNSNSNGQLGVGDTLPRKYATPITSVTGFTQISPHGQAGLRTDGSLWAWSMSNLYHHEPQRVGTLTGLQKVLGGYLIGAGGDVSQWSVSSYSNPVLVLNTVQTAAGAPLVLQP